MTRYVKIAVSLPARAAENARRAVREGRAPSVSAYIAASLEQRYSREETIAMLDEMLEETGGPPTAAERRSARRELGLTKPRRPRQPPSARNKPPVRTRRRP